MLPRLVGLMTMAESAPPQLVELGLAEVVIKACKLHIPRLQQWRNNMEVSACMLGPQLDEAARDVRAAMDVVARFGKVLH